MSEDYTWQDVPVTDVTTLAARVQELEHALAQADANMVALAERNAALADENARLHSLVECIDEYADYYSNAVWLFSTSGESPMTFSEWIADYNEGKVQPDDDPDAPLTLAAIDDEDGDL